MIQIWIKKISMKKKSKIYNLYWITKNWKFLQTRKKKRIEFPSNDFNGNLTCDYKNKKVINFNETNYSNKKKSSHEDSSAV